MGPVPAPSSGYLQFVRHETLIGLAAEKGAVIRLLHRPGHFLVDGYPMAVVWPPGATEGVSRALRRAHITGPNRTLAQDLAFAVDQLVEIAIRALSPAVNDTFTALTCIDWLGANLCKVTTGWHPVRVHRDSHGYVRLITAHVSYARLIERAFEKIRQPAAACPRSDPPTRRSDEDHRPLDNGRAARATAQSGGDDPSGQRGVNTRAG